MISNIELFYEPVKILNQLSNEYTAEMTEGQSAFLCGLIKKYRPSKLVEIGVAAGGTTAVMLNCIHMLGLKTRFFSVDLLENFYQNPNKKTGYLAEEFKAILNEPVHHTLYTGKYAVEQIEQIGKEIDFLVLDTVHLLPGEILDFLAYCPYLKPGSVVVLHDTAMNHYTDYTDAFATRVLFSTVNALKIQYQDANIAAFVVTDDTIRNIESVFSALMVTWKYFPGQKELALYRDFYSIFYSDEELAMFDMAVKLNQKTISRKKDLELEKFTKIYKLISEMKGKRVFVYGCGNFGRQFYHILEKCDIDLGGYIVSDDQRLSESDKKVFFLSDIELDDGCDIILVGVNPSLWEEVGGQLQKRGFTNYILPPAEMFDYLK